MIILIFLLLTVNSHAEEMTFVGYEEVEDCKYPSSKVCNAETGMSCVIKLNDLCVMADKIESLEQHNDLCVMADKIKSLEQHVEILGHAVKNQQYITDVLTNQVMDK